LGVGGEGGGEEDKHLDVPWLTMVWRSAWKVLKTLAAHLQVISPGWTKAFQTVIVIHTKSPDWKRVIYMITSTPRLWCTGLVKGHIDVGLLGASLSQKVKVTLLSVI
jgi:hypothetical protein